MKLMIKTTFMIAVVVGLIACQGEVATHEEGNALAVKYLQAINGGKYEEAFTVVSDDFFSTRSKDEWIKYHKSIAEIMGPVISVKLSRKHIDDRFSGRFYMFQFSVKHENGFTSEMITMLQKINSKDPLKVFAHKIDSSKLKKLNSRF